jgi:hypothetical protein
MNRVRDIIRNIIEEDKQKFSSAGTSIPGDVVSVIVKLHNSGIFDDAETVLDYGAGKYGRNSKWLREQGLSVYSYDKFNGTSSANGWEEVSNKLPRDKFDVVFSSYLLNVVPIDVEKEIIKYCESNSTGNVFHVTRGRSGIVDMIWRNVSGKTRNRVMLSYIENNYPEYYDKIVDGSITKEDAIELSTLGVQTAEDDFQRVPDLSIYGYKRKGADPILWTK